LTEGSSYLGITYLGLTDGILTFLFYLFLVRPLEYIHLQSGITVVIYADEGQNYIEKREDPIFDLVTFLRFAIKCTDCLEFIHRNNVVHGEIRLSTFQWAGDDASRVKMWNFGSGTKSLETYLTSEGWRKTANNQESMNKLQNLLSYMSPEQTGRTTYVPDHRSDIYSLGIVFFCLLTGKAPFSGGPLDILNGILSKKMPLVNEFQLDIPNVVARIIEKMTHKVEIIITMLVCLY
jgi:serine/threonine protein kinase